MSGGGGDHLRADPDFRALFESAPGLYLVLTPALTIVAVSTAYLRATMTERAAILGRGIFDAFPDDPNDPGATGEAGLRASLERVLKSRRADAMNSPVLGPTGQVDYIIHRVEDVRRPESQAVGTLSHELRTPLNAIIGFAVMEQANDAILLLDAKGIVEANRQAEALLGRPRAGLTGRRYEDFVVAEDGTPSPMVFGAATTRVADQRLRRADGSTVSVDVSASPVRLGEETIVLLILRDMTERKDAEKRLQDSERQYRLLFDGNPHPMWVYDPDTLAFLAVNQAAIDLYGYSREEFLGMTIRDVRPPEDVPAFLASLGGAAEHGHGSDGVWKHRFKSGAVAAVEIASNSLLFRGRLACLVLVTDVSEKRRLEAQLLQAQKMEAVGRLAGGVAHDFNNLIGVISGYSELLRKSLEPHHPGQVRVGEIQKAAERAAALTRQLLTFSRQQVLETRVLNLNAIVTDLEQMLHRLIGEDVQLTTRTAADLGAVQADSGQIEQVVLNLVVNARDAMPRGGALVLETANAVLDENYARTHADVRPGRYVMLAVNDTGEGMSEDTQSHIFEPFFTTKERGKGTGLGLATVFGIVKQSGGHVGVYSEVGVGSTFKVYLPRVDGDATAVRPAAEAAVPRPGTETVLLVEDAEALRMMIKEILEVAGYTVVACADAREAVQADGVSRAHLLLTDVVMPRTSGADLARTLCASHPALKVLFMSGYTDDAIGHHGVLEKGAHFIQKPFTTDALLRKVRDVLDGA